MGGEDQPLTDLISLRPISHRSEFIQSSYKNIKSANPNLPFLVREAQGTPARIFARFGESGLAHEHSDQLEGWFH